MSYEAATDTVDLLNSAPKGAFRANLFTFTLLNGEVYRFTDWRRPLTIGGYTYLAGPQRVERGEIRCSRGVAVSTHTVKIFEANGSLTATVAQGFFRRAVYQMDRTFSLDAQTWTTPMTRFFGRVNSMPKMDGLAIEFTVKSMLDDLDRDYPQDVLEPDCNAVVFDRRCGLNAANYRVSGSAGAGSTRLQLVTSLGQADGYFTQGVITFTSGVMKGASYMVKSHAGGVLVPTPPFLSLAVGDTFTVTPGCDKTQATCTSKYGYSPTSGAAPYFRGAPYVPDPTVIY